MDILIQFIPFLTVLAVTAGAVWWARRTVRIADEKGIDLHLKGIRGWLVVLVLWQVLSILAALWALAEAIGSFGAYAEQGQTAIAAAKLAIALVGLLLWGGTGYLMFGRKRAFVRLFVITALYQVAAGLALDVLAVAADEIAASEIGSTTVGHGLVGSVVGAAVWIGYVLKSRRVKNTFVR